MRRESMWATAPITSQYDQNGTRNPYGGSSVLQQTCVVEGNWRKELLFILQQELNLYQVYQQQIAECDTALAAHLQTLEFPDDPLRRTGVRISPQTMRDSR